MPRITDRFFYHGAPCSIDTFDYAFTGHGNDELGAGFYFTTDKAGAIGYTEQNKVTKLAGLPLMPTLHKVRLKLENPLGSELIGGLTHSQAKAILQKHPNLEEKMWDFYDLGSMSLEKAVNNAATLCSQFQRATLISRINTLAYTFYGNENIRELNQALKEVLGYDGVLHTEGKNYVAVAWFPEQIEVVQRIKYQQNKLDDEGPNP